MNPLNNVDSAGMQAILDRSEIPDYIPNCPDCGPEKVIDYGGVYECAVCQFMVGELNEEDEKKRYPEWRMK